MTSKKFEIDGIGYVVDAHGVVHQEPPKITQRYDREYVETRYCSIPEGVRNMSFLRIGFIVGIVRSFSTVLDIGYGNADFLALWQQWKSWNIEPWGFDVSGFPLPEGCKQATEREALRGGRKWDVVTFFDSLEHFRDLDFLHEMQARHVVVTAPWCHYDRLGEEWFGQWKHRRPGEHIHHFNPVSLSLMMEAHGYEFMCNLTLEDGIRQPTNSHENTFTAVYKNRIHWGLRWPKMKP